MPESTGIHDAPFVGLLADRSGGVAAGAADVEGAAPVILLAIQINSLASLIVAAGAAFGVVALGWAYKRGGTVKVWQETAAGYKERADQLDRSLQVAEQRIQVLEHEVGVLKAKTDLDSLRIQETEHHAETMAAVNGTLELVDRHVKEETTVWVALMKVLPTMQETVAEILGDEIHP